MDHVWESIYSALQQISPIPQEEWDQFKSLSIHKTMAKNTHFVQVGELADSIGICVSGLFRLYYTTPDGDEFNKSFCTKYDFVASYSSLLLKTPSLFSIQALMDSELIVIRYEEFQSLYSRHICWERLGRILIEQLFVKKEMRERELLLLSAEERYQIFLDKYEDVVGKIKQYHVASYLGITPVALSRIRQKLT